MSELTYFTRTPLTPGNLLVTAGFEPTEIRVLTLAYPPRGGEWLWKANRFLFHAAARGSAILLRTRQLFCRATV